MGFKFCTILLLFFCAGNNLYAQGCTVLGQNPYTAFPVCGSSVFKQDTVPVCTSGNILVKDCINDGIVYQALNPYWYKFTCFQSGTLGFLIKPNNPTDDYDWQIFDVTGRDPDSVYTTDINTAEAIFVVCNWAYPSVTANTGTSSSAILPYACATTPSNPNPSSFSKMPNLIKGHNYLLLISHFQGNNQSGYSLSFGGGTASITDTTPPRLQSAFPNCDGTQIRLQLNKSMKCSSLSPDGSDFVLSPAVAKVTSATGNCAAGFDMDSVVVNLSNSLAPGTYWLVAKNGNDNNTLLDNCDNSVPVNDSVPFSIFKNQPTPFDSIAPVGCAPASIQLVFKKYIKCSTITPDGSDFVVTGTTPVTVIGADGVCNNGLSNVINVRFSTPLVRAGTYQVKLVTGIDGNTIIDECSEQTGAGATLSFTTADTVSAAFTSQVKFGCTTDTVIVNHNGANEVNSWNWLFNDDSIYNTLSVTKLYYKAYGIETALLTVSNGVCTDTSSQSFNLNNQLKAQFSSPVYICPEDAAVFKDSSVGNIATWYWNFGNGNTTYSQVPPSESYPPSATRNGTYYPIELIVHDANCYDTSYHEMKVLYSCYIAVPTAFTPNGDGNNDYLYPLNAYKAVNLEFRVFNRWGQQVFETRDWTRKWDGTINGNPQSSGVYVWMLSYTNVDTGQKFSQKGTTVLVR